MKPLFYCLFFLAAISACYSQTTVTVSTPTDFLKAIGSNKTIYLNSGDYDLSSVVGVGSSNVTWEDQYDGSQILISNVSNLKIIGKGNARILVTPMYTWVMKFYQSQNITLDNFTMGHIVGGSCIGGVVSLDSCKNVKITNCKMFGSGTYGMEANNCDNIAVDKCDIYKCTYGLLVLSSSTNVNFSRTRFRETGEFDLISISNCKSVNFRTCVFEKNFNSGDYSSYYFFKIDTDYNYDGISSGITINTCSFRDNKIYYFTNDYNSKIIFGDNKYERNDFTAPVPTANKNVVTNTINYEY